MRMNYDLHPIFVHFPIALLSLYTVIEILPFGRWLPQVNWRHLKRVLLFVGVIGAFVALYTGEIAEHLNRPNRQLVNDHALFSQISTWIYGALLLGEVLSILNKSHLMGKFHVVWVKNLSTFLEKFLCKSVYVKVLAVLGIIALTVAGLLGGVMVYGTTADPVASFVLNLLGISM